MTQPTDLLLPFSTDATFTNGPAQTQGQPVREQLTEAALAEGFLPGTRLRYQYLNDILGKLYDELIHRQEDVSAWCGDASDGDRTITNGETLTLDRDYYFNELTVDNGGTIVWNGYRLFGRRVEVNGLIHCDGANGQDATPGGPDTPGSGGDGAPNGSVQGGRNGGDGAVFGGNDGGDGGSSSYFRWGSAGFDGGDGAANAGGSAGSASQATAAQGGIPRDVAMAIRGCAIDLSTATARIVQAVGGMGGGGGASNVSSAGGGGGGGAGVGILSANELIVGATGIVRANGGDGGEGTQSQGLDGGQGGAGAIRLVYRRFTLTAGGIIEARDGVAVGASAPGVDRTSTNVIQIRV